jgi:hypothetical protein
MAVVERKTKTGTTYRIAFRDADGKQIWEHAGSDRRVAQALERQRKREVRAGTFARGKRPTMPFGEFLEAWGRERRNRNAADDRRIIEAHLRSRSWLAALPCEELRPRHAEKLVRELLETVSAQTGHALGEKCVSNIYGLSCTACSDARRQEIMFVDPCILPRGLLSRQHRRGTRQPYARENVARLIAQNSEASVFAALALFHRYARRGNLRPPLAGHRRRGHSSRQHSSDCAIRRSAPQDRARAGRAVTEDPDPPRTRSKARLVAK